MNPEHPNYSERCRRESTRNVVFLLQRKRCTLVAEPENCIFDGENWIDDDSKENRCVLTLKQMRKRECTVEYWCTESVWLTREEATKYAKAHEYNYPSGWKVYAVCSNGRMAELIEST